MRILIARQNFQTPDALRELCGLVDEALARKHQVVLLTGDIDALPKNFPPEVEIQQGGKHDRIFRKHFRNLCKNGGFDRTLALGNLSGAQFCVPDIPQLFPTPPIPRPGILRPFLRRRWNWEQELFRAPSKTQFFASGEIQKLTLRLYYGVIPTRIHNIPPLLDEEALGDPKEQELTLFRKAHGCEDPQTLLIVTFADDWEAAGVDRSINALAYMPETLRKRLRFLVIGGGGPEGLKRLQETARSMAFPREQVQYLPTPQPTRQLIYHGADLLILPAREDHSKNLLTDAMACGLPVLCTASCGMSPFVQAFGCSVVNNPFDQELLEEALACYLPKVQILRQMLTNRAASLPGNTRAQQILQWLEAPLADGTAPALSPETAARLVNNHLDQIKNFSAMKMDRKRNISRCLGENGDSYIVKEYKKIHFWDGNRHARRCQNGTALLRYFTPQCQAATRNHPGSSSSFLIFSDCGKGNFFTEEYLDRPNAKMLFAACGSTLAMLHTAGIYHMDTKPANFVLNKSATQGCPYAVCLVDCDNVRKTPLPMPCNLRIHNVAQFISGTGNLARRDLNLWIKLIRAFQDGYNRHALLSQSDLMKFWNDFWEFMAVGRHVEYTLPFQCLEENLQKIRNRLH